MGRGAFGVRSAMPTAKAMKLCPQAILTPGRYQLYKEVSAQVHEVFRTYTDLIEPLSIDEAYLDVTENKRNQLCNSDCSFDSKGCLRKNGLTCSVGVSFNKFLAKMASGYHKPSGVTVITPENAKEFIRTIPIEDFYGVGKSERREIETSGDSNRRRSLSII